LFLPKVITPNDIRSNDVNPSNILPNIVASNKIAQIGKKPQHQMTPNQMTFCRMMQWPTTLRQTTQN
jgi:hypothetical protein